MRFFLLLLQYFFALHLAHLFCLQAARTYLEKHLDSFPSCSMDELVQHGLKALAATLSDGELTKANVTVAIVGKDSPFVVLEEDDVEPYVLVSGFF